jgi:hypothetical protein
MYVILGRMIRAGKVVEQFPHKVVVVECGSRGHFLLL